MSVDESPPALIAVVCRLCGTRMYASESEIGTAIRCPDCETLNRVQRPKPAPRRLRPRDPGQYRIGDTEWRKASQKRAADKPRMRVKCPVCGTGLYPTERQAGRRVRCPDCDTHFTLPPWQAPRKPPASASAPTPTYELGEAPVRPPISPTPISGEQAGTTLPPEPTEPGQTGVVNFLLSPAVFRRWVAATAGAWIVVLLLALAGWAIADGQAHANVIGAGAVMACAIWPTIWYVSFSAATGIAIVEQTAGGTDIVENWPESDWRYWLFAMLFLGFQGLVAGTAASVFARLAVAAGGAISVWIWLPVFLFLFPLLLLSALENDSPVGVFSLPVWQSLWRNGRAWAALHVKSVSLAAAVAAPAALILWGVRAEAIGGTFGLYALLLYVGPATTTLWLAYCRWTGILAWQITHGTESDEHSHDSANDDQERSPYAPRWHHPAIREHDDRSSSDS